MKQVSECKGMLRDGQEVLIGRERMRLERGRKVYHTEMHKHKANRHLDSNTPTAALQLLLLQYKAHLPSLHQRRCITFSMCHCITRHPFVLPGAVSKQDLLRIKIVSKK